LVQLEVERSGFSWSPGEAQEGDVMPRRGRTEEQIIAALRQAQGGIAVKEACRQAV
jgi:hypothetical protein